MQIKQINALEAAKALSETMRGGTPYSHWVLRKDILSALEFLGFKDIRIGYEEPGHELGPAFGLVAMREKP